MSPRGRLTVERTIVSPDRRWVCQLERVGEIRFGPPYFSLWLTREPAREPWWWQGRRALFGDHVRFSESSRFLIAERWRSLDVPNIDLVAIDLRAGAMRVAVAGIASVGALETEWQRWPDEPSGVGIAEPLEDWPFPKATC